MSRRERTAEPGQLRSPRAGDVALLRQRAEALGRRITSVAEPTGRVSLLFTLSGERYALDAARVLEVSVLRNLTPLPATAAPRYGLTLWRGVVLLVFDLRPALGLDPGKLTDLTRLIVIRGAPAPFGVLVDSVETTGTPLEDQGGFEGGAAPGLPGLLRGATREGVMVIDPDRLLAWVGREPESTRG